MCALQLGVGSRDLLGTSSGFGNAGMLGVPSLPCQWLRQEFSVFSLVATGRALPVTEAAGIIN